MSDEAYEAFRHGATPLHAIVARGRLRATLTMLGPAFVAAVAYVDPGNFATNIQGGARFGYLLLWVVLAANLMAMLIQHLSAKLGIVTDRDLPELCRDHYPRPVAWGLWIQAEAMAMATDVAEFIGAALGLNLLFGVPLLPAGLITGVIAFALLELQRHGFRRFELAITAFLGLILLGFLYETLKVGPSGGDAVQGLVPHLDGAASVYLAVGIIGATVMPHAIYLHSALTKGRTPVRNEAERRRVLALREGGRDRCSRPRRPRQHGDAHRRRGALPRHARLVARGHPRRGRTRGSRTWSAARRHSRSPWRCSRPARRPRASAPTRARS